MHHCAHWWRCYSIRHAPDARNENISKVLFWIAHCVELAFFCCCSFISSIDYEARSKEMNDWYDWVRLAHINDLLLEISCIFSSPFPTQHLSLFLHRFALNRTNIKKSCLCDRVDYVTYLELICLELICLKLICLELICLELIYFRTYIF